MQARESIKKRIFEFQFLKRDVRENTNYKTTV